MHALTNPPTTATTDVIDDTSIFSSSEAATTSGMRIQLFDRRRDSESRADLHHACALRHWWWSGVGVLEGREERRQEMATRNDCDVRLQTP